MTRYLAEFATAEKLAHAARAMRKDGHILLDCFTPFPIEGIDGLLTQRAPTVRRTMLVAGVIVAVLAYALQWYSSVINYPLNIGGRPLNSWPVFLLVPFEVGILAAAVAGLLAFLRGCGLPRLHNRLFDSFGFERATQDRFFLLAATETPLRDLRGVLRGAGALNVEEVAPR
jgi:hypothetical protein